MKRFESHDEFDGMAAQWIAKRDRGMSASDEAALARWLDADSRHAEAFARCESAWGALPALQQLPTDQLGGLMSTRRPRRRISLVLWSTVVAAAASIALGLFLRPSLPVQVESHTIQRYTAGMDAEARFVLPDGSTADLHRGSEIIVGYNSTVRRVRLLRGEVHISVANSSRQPFIVHAGNVVVRDLGTAFNVRLEPDRVAVIVTEGRVTVSHEGASPAAAVQTGSGGEVDGSTLLIAGQQALVQTAAPESAIAVEQSSPAEMERVLAWKSRRLTFARTALSEAVLGLNRYNQRQLVIADAETGAVLVAGSFQADNVDAFVRLLETSFGITAEPRGENETVLRKTK